MTLSEPSWGPENQPELHQEENDWMGGAGQGHEQVKINE